jgi:adenylate kinase
MKCIVIFGIQGSGKGTQADLLSEELGYQHINIGNLLREQVAMQTELGLMVKETIIKGALVSDELVFQVVESTLEPGCPGIVFDGFPRNLHQAEYLARHYEILGAFYLDLDEQEAIARISARRECSECGKNYNLKTNKPIHEDVCDSCGGRLKIRKDDRPEAIKKRLVEFYEHTLILKQFFAEQGLLTVIDAGGDIEDISKEILIKAKTLV